MWIRTKDKKWYICELCGVNYVTWVTKQDILFALIFPADKIDDWVMIMESMTGKKLEKVKVG
jgi:hypothetical protein